MSSLLAIAVKRVRTFDAEEDQRRAERFRQEEAARVAAEKHKQEYLRKMCRKLLTEWTERATVVPEERQSNIRQLGCTIEPFAQNIGDYRDIKEGLKDLCKEEGFHSVEVTRSDGRPLIAEEECSEVMDCGGGMGSEMRTFLRDVWKGDDSQTWHVRIKIKM